MSRLELQQQDDGVVLSIRARPGARRNGIDGVHAGALKVSVTQAAEKGKANNAVIALLAKELHLSKSQFTLLSGQTSARKRLLIQGVLTGQLLQKLAGVIGADG